MFFTQRQIGTLMICIFRLSGVLATTILISMSGGEGTLSVLTRGGGGAVIVEIVKIEILEYLDYYLTMTLPRTV